MKLITFRQVVFAALIVALSMTLRLVIGLSQPYSGKGVPPMFGDFEAQRHWIELTIGHPEGPSGWYRQSAVNNLSYWGLDYPPLTAYHSWAMGRVSSLLYGGTLFQDNDSTSTVSMHEAAFGFQTSQGNEHPHTIAFMRWSVVISELLVYVSACVSFAVLLGSRLDRTSYSMSLTAIMFRQKKLEAKVPQKTFLRRARILRILFLLLNAAVPMIFIDHGHFQYNSVAIGLLVWGVVFAVRHHLRQAETPADDQSRSDGPSSKFLVMSVVCVALSMSFKQMSLYYAPGFGIWYFAQCIAAGRPRSLSTATRRFQWKSFVKSIVFCGVAGVGVFAGVTMPFWFPAADKDNTMVDVVQRIFAVGRGLYEDKVSNVWCSASVAWKLPQTARNVAIRRISVATSIDAVVLHQCCEGNAFVPTHHLGLCEPLDAATMSMHCKDVLAAEQALTLRVCLMMTLLGGAFAMIRTVQRALKKGGPNHAAVVVHHSGKLWVSLRKAATKARIVKSAELLSVAVTTEVLRSAESLLWLLLASSLSFFLFSYHVHEKSILLPCAPAVLLLAVLEAMRFEEQTEVQERFTDPQLCEAERTALVSFYDKKRTVRTQKMISLWLFLTVSVASLGHLAQKDKLLGLWFVSVVSSAVLGALFVRSNEQDPVLPNVSLLRPTSTSHPHDKASDQEDDEREVDEEGDDSADDGGDSFREAEVGGRRPFYWSVKHSLRSLIKLWWTPSSFAWWIVLPLACVEEALRMQWLDHHPRYPHLGVIAQCALCCMVFLWMLVKSSSWV